MRKALAILCLILCLVLAIANLRGAAVALLNIRSGSMAYQASYVVGVAIAAFALAALIFFATRWALRSLAK